MLNAGHETTTNLIGNGLFALTEWPRKSSDGWHLVGASGRPHGDHR